MGYMDLGITVCKHFNAKELDEVRGYRKVSIGEGWWITIHFYKQQNPLIEIMQIVWLSQASSFLSSIFISVDMSVGLVLSP